MLTAGFSWASSDLDLVSPDLLRRPVILLEPVGRSKSRQDPTFLEHFVQYSTARGPPFPKPCVFALHIFAKCHSGWPALRSTLAKGHPRISGPGGFLLDLRTTLFLPFFLLVRLPPPPGTSHVHCFRSSRLPHGAISCWVPSRPDLRRPSLSIDPSNLAARWSIIAGPQHMTTTTAALAHSGDPLCHSPIRTGTLRH